MSDIFGRSTLAPTDTITRRQIASMIKRYVTSGLNLVDVDPGEIVVFGDSQGKLKTSNLSRNDLLTKQPTADDDSIVVFKAGKLEPSYKITTITDKFDTINNINVIINNAVNNLATLQSSYDNHINAFNTLKRNFEKVDDILDKILDSNIKNIKLKDFKAFLDGLTTIKKITDDIQDIYSHLGVWVDPNPITATITNIKQDITAINSWIGVIRDTKSISDLIAIKKSIDDLKIISDKVNADSSKLDKVKASHEAKDIKSLSYVVHQKLDNEYLADDDRSFSERLMEKTSWNETITGIYRISIFSEHQFNIQVNIFDIDKDTDTAIRKGVSKGVNTTLIALKDKPPSDISIMERFFPGGGNFHINVDPVDPAVVRAKYSYIVEFVSPI